MEVVDEGDEDGRRRQQSGDDSWHVIEENTVIEPWQDKFKSALPKLIRVYVRFRSLPKPTSSSEFVKLRRTKLQMKGE